jgi:hypothetical protein
MPAQAAMAVLVLRVPLARLEVMGRVEVLAAVAAMAVSAA